MIAGLEDITAGEIQIGGMRVNDLEPKDRDIAMVFQSYALYPHMTVADNMAFSLKLRGADKSEIDSRVNRAADILGLGPYLLRFPRQLSGGQRQRVAMGRAIVRAPKAFLFDEPLSNLDAALRVQTRLEIARLHRRLKATMIYVTHDQVEAMTLADRIVVLNKGVVEQVGSPMELYNNPANLFVAGFIGSPQMNFIEGSMLGESAATVGIRPEHISVASDSGTWKGSVLHAEHLGADTILYLSTETAGFVTARLFGEHRFGADDVLYATPDPARIYRFGADGRILA
jgi:multiple sugar transport system ATP-binding protein